MPGDDEVIRIGAEIDVAPLVSGMQQAVASVDSGTAKMATSFTTAGAAATQMAAKLQADGLSAKEVASALQNLGFSADEVNGALGTTATRLDNVTRAAVSTSSAVRDMGGSFAVARVEAGALSGSVGMLEGGLARVALASETLGPIMMAAFPAFAALALFEIVGRVADAFKAAADQVMGYTEAVRKAEQEDIKASQEIEGHAVTAEEAHRKLAQTFQEVQKLGKESYAEKFSAAWEKSAKDTSTAWKYLYAQGYLVTHIYDSFANAEATVADRGKQLQDQTRSLQGDLGGITAATEKLSLSELEAQNRADIIGKSKIAQLQSELTLLAQKKDLDEAVAAAEAQRTAKSPEEASDLAASAKVDIEKKFISDTEAKRKQIAEESARESIALERATSEARTSIELAELSRQESVVKQLASMKLLTAEQETAALVRIENEQAEARRKSIEDQISAAKKLQSATGEDQAPKIEALEAQLVTLKTNTQTKITDIENEGSRKRIAQDIEEMNERISNGQRVASAQFSLEEQFARQGFESHKITSEQETNMLRAAENERYESTRRGLEEQLTEYKKHEELNKKEVSETNAAIESLDIHHQTELNRIQFDGERQRIEAVKRTSEEQLRSTQESANRELETTRRLDDERIRNHIETLSQWVSSERAALDQWYAAQKQTLERVIAETRAAFGEMSPEYRKVIDDLARLDQEFAEKNREINQKIVDQSQRAYNEIAAAFNSAFDRMLTTHTSFLATMTRFWDQMVEGWAKMGIQIVATYVQQLAQVVIQEVLTQTKLTAVQDGGLTVRKASENAWDAFLTAIGITRVAKASTTETSTTVAHTAALTARQTADTAAFTKTQTLETLEVSQFTATQAAETTAYVDALAARQAAETTAATTSAAAATAQTAAKIAANVSVAQSDAAVAAADTLAYYAAIDPPLAPAAAAAMLAVGETFVAAAAFEKGGIIPGRTGEPVPIVGHAQEAVLPAGLTKMLLGVSEAPNPAMNEVTTASALAAANNSDITGAKAFESMMAEHAPAFATAGSQPTAVEPDLRLASTNFNVREPGANLHQSINRGVQRGGDQNASNTTNHYHANFRSEFHGIAGHDELEDLFDKKLAPKVQQAMRRGKIKKS